MSQPLESSPFSIEAVEAWALERAASMPSGPFRITSHWHIDRIRNHVPNERTAHYTAQLIQSENYGMANGPPPRFSLSDGDLVGLDARTALRERRFRDDVERTALVDLVMAHVSKETDERITLDGMLQEKYRRRSRLFADEAERLLQRNRVKGDRARIGIIGATAGIIGALTERGFEVWATDQAADIVGKDLGGVTVRDASANTELVMNCDLAMITGMAMPNRTLPALMRQAKAHYTATLIWAITGRNLGPYYTAHGVDCVVSDPSPFLLLPGPATIAVARHRV